MKSIWLKIKKILVPGWNLKQEIKGFKHSQKMLLKKTSIICKVATVLLVWLVFFLKMLTDLEIVKKNWKGLFFWNNDVEPAIIQFFQFFSFTFVTFTPTISMDKVKGIKKHPSAPAPAIILHKYSEETRTKFDNLER